MLGSKHASAASCICPCVLLVEDICRARHMAVAVLGRRWHMLKEARAETQDATLKECGLHSGNVKQSAASNGAAPEAQRDLWADSPHVEVRSRKHLAILLIMPIAPLRTSSYGAAYRSTIQHGCGRASGTVADERTMQQLSAQLLAPAVQ